MVLEMGGNIFSNSECKHEVYRIAKALFKKIGFNKAAVSVLVPKEYLSIIREFKDSADCVWEDTDLNDFRTELWKKNESKYEKWRIKYRDKRS